MSDISESDVVPRRRFRTVCGEFWPLMVLAAAVFGMLMVCSGQYGFVLDSSYRNGR